MQWTAGLFRSREIIRARQHGITRKNPCVFCADPKNPRVFHRPRKPLLVKISDPKKSLGPPPRHTHTHTPSSVKYVSGTPGDVGL